MRKTPSWASSCSILFGMISFHLATTPGFASSAGSVASGGLTISGTLQTKPATSGNRGTGSVTVSGSEQSKPGTAATYATGTVIISGSERSRKDCSEGCTFVYDSGSVSITVNGFTATASYGRSSTYLTIASSLTDTFNSSPSSPVTATGGAQITLTSKVAGGAGNYPLSSNAVSDDPTLFLPSFTVSPPAGSLTGGVDAGPQVYDHGTCTVTVNGTAYSKSYNQGDTASTIAAGLASTISSGTLATATASGGMISLTAKTTGTATNYSLTSSTTCSNDSANFGSPSFTTSTSGATLTGGTNGSPALIDAGTVRMSVGGYTATANYGNATGQDPTASAVASELVNRIQAQLLASNPPFTIAVSGASINITWGSVGAAGNVTVTTTSTTTQTADFSTPSFASCSITTNPQNCSTTLSGGADPMPPTLGTFSPAAGAVGTAVTITGTNFGATQGPGSGVAFNGTVATPTSWSDGIIVVPVPSGATTGGIVVTAAGGQAISNTSFTVTVPGPPHIDGVSPASGPFGKKVTITGTNFGAIQGSSTVKFKDTEAPATSWSDTSIVALVPGSVGAGSAPVVVTVVDQSNNSVNSNPADFMITPEIFSLSLPTGPVQMGFEITGNDFGEPPGIGDQVRIGTTPMNVVLWKDDRIIVQVPPGASSGDIVVTVKGAASNGKKFTVIEPFDCPDFPPQ